MRLTIPTTVSLPQTVFKKMESQAKHESLTRSELIRKAFQFYVDEQQWRELYRFGAVSVRKSKYKEQDIEKIVDSMRKI